MMVACGVVIAAFVVCGEGLVFATFRWLWLLHRVLRLIGLVVFIVRDDVLRKYSCLVGLWHFNRGAAHAKGSSTGSRSSQAHVGGWIQRDGLREPFLGPKKHHVLACRYCSGVLFFGVMVTGLLGQVLR